MARLKMVSGIRAPFTKNYKDKQNKEGGRNTYLN